MEVWQIEEKLFKNYLGDMGIWSISIDKEMIMQKYMQKIKMKVADLTGM